MRRAVIASIEVLVLTVSVGQSTGAFASEAGAEIPRDLILQRFAVARDGDAIVIPIRFGGGDHLFLVDTGSSVTMFDVSLSLRERRGTFPVGTPSGHKVVRTFEPPTATMGALPCRFSEIVASMDLKRLREANGRPIEGVLGMDVLGQHVLHIDFDKGELLFLKSAPNAAGHPVPMSWESGNIPRVAGFVTGSDEIRFAIDTGLLTVSTGLLQNKEMRHLQKKGKLKAIGMTTGENLSGESLRAIVQVGLLAIGETSIQSPEFEASPSLSALGLGFWSRFVVTFDFPRRRVFLTPGKTHGRPIRRDSSGLHLILKDGAVVVERVSASSPAMYAGFQQGDILLKLGELIAGETSLFELGAARSRTGRFKCMVRSGGDNLRLTLEIPE